ncbi:NAD-dependent epimerase/dehydratase family protein [Pseudomonas sp. 5P_3.1_Bac2]|uniref:NAD-dependent epimerase/dehydratase family protein n=1 Tax=Pseudomonas sp. 5P_3.1_Bac2 TaxID=2971617 RepID=UPI0021C56F3D|nr:NAD-dependent epimerase/dehydratase family protein [Pseudomonas sp. 5P_3.1_Bac2]MCU1719330.1 NAD-dependent epimerase/dehydratase family protein [Pseudomonas sp. 5P_3.1_Bac2]
MSDSRPILVTGGAGFIGSHLVDALLARGYAVRVLDNLSMGKLSNLPLANPQLQFIQGDVADAAVLSRAVEGCAAVAHLAAVASVQASVDNPLATHQSNFIGTLNLCEAMRLHGVQRVLFASSAAVYGNHGDGVAVTEDSPKAPLTPYAVDKLAGEYYLDFYAREHGLQPVILRFFNIFGPRQDPSSPYSGVISIFTQRAQQGLPITVFGDGEQTRDFFYIDDLLHLLLQGLLAPTAVTEPVNVGWDQAVSLNQLLATIGQLCGRELTVSYAAPRPGDIRHSRAANQRLQRYFQLPEATPMAEGLRQLLAAS